MVESGRTGSGSPVEFGFRNPDRPRLGVEVLDFARLRARIPAETAASVHRTDFHQLFLITSGAVRTMVDFVEHPGPTGTVVSVCPGRVLRLPRPVADGGAEALVVFFTAVFLPRPASVRPLLGPFGPVVWTVPAEEWRDLTRAVRELRSEYRRAIHEEDRALTVELLRQLLGAVLLRIARLPVTDGSARTGGAFEGTFSRFQHELERSFATTRNAADYAARVGYSLRSLNRVCQAATGRSAKALVDARVALEAQRLLAHTDLPAAAVGHRLGFGEPTNFGKFFVRATGLTPGAFRDRERRA